MPLLAGRNDEGNQTCVQCIEGTACCVMEGVIKMAKEYCERTECPCVKRRVCFPACLGLRRGLFSIFYWRCAYRSGGDMHITYIEMTSNTEANLLCPPNGFGLQSPAGDWLLQCEWAMEHKDLVLGILLHRVRPGEWGCGYCFGMGPVDVVHGTYHIGQPRLSTAMVVPGRCNCLD